MVTWSSEQKKCALCGHDNQVSVICSYTTFGGPDLDLRPPPMKRDTMQSWVEDCSNCKYCSNDLSAPVEDIELVRDFVNSNEYIHNLTDNELANKFIQQSRIQLIGKKSCVLQIYLMVWSLKDKLPSAILSTISEFMKFVPKDPTTLFYSNLQAAWCCDDSRLLQESINLRLNAADALEKFPYIIQSEPTRFCLHVDILRRANAMDRAQKIIELAQKCEEVNKHETFSKVIKFQSKLVSEGDVNCYTVSDIE
eukprot:NODE_6336_length_897_cov_38.824289_g5744_i0.p1 GENE.NODE_6336_length_897_cov_38.824289_g5744_i0~~NODE_6336_length_897_cov_38.824289_g5744_i0.p1  ORF type:complete len:252 (+),score=36.38 NODE_6336_length_897_cov_38.824289_g5744_i0:55-810(+)